MMIDRPFNVAERPGRVDTPASAAAAGPAAVPSADQNRRNEDPLANKAVFLQLLVSQLRYQNPLQPADGVQFVSQLAQFSGLEQSLQMREDLAAIRQAIEKLAAAPAKPS